MKGKRLFKTLSIIMIVSMLSAMLILPAVSFASTEDLLIDEDFSAVTSMEDLKNLGWTGNGMNCNPIPASIQEGKLVMTGDEYKIPIDMEDGDRYADRIYKVSYDASSTGLMLVSFGAESNGNLNRALMAGIGNTSVLFAHTESYMPEYKTLTKVSGETVHVEHEIDYGKRTIFTKLTSQAGVQFATVNEFYQINTEYKLYGIWNMTIENWGGTNIIDNIKFGYANESNRIVVPGAVPYSDSFDTTTGDKLSEAGWVNTTANVTLHDYVDSTTFAGTNHGTVLNLKSKCVKYDFASAVTNGKLKVSADFYFTATGAKPWISYWNASGHQWSDFFSMNRQLDSGCSDRDVVNFKDNWYYNNGGFFRPAFNTWYMVEVVLDIDADKVSTRIYNDGKLVAATKDIAQAITNVKAIQIAEQAGVDVFFDNFHVEAASAAEMVADYGLYIDNFDDTESSADFRADGWVYDNEALDFSSDKLKITAGNGITRELVSAIAYGNNPVVKVSYDIWPNGDTIIGFKPDGTNSGCRVLLGRYSKVDVVVGAFSGQTNSVNLCANTAGSKLHATHVIDYGAKTIKTVVKNAQGTKYENLTTGFVYRDTGAAALGGINEFTIENWSGTAEIDNLKIEYNYALPELSASAVTMADVNGNVVTSIASGVTPAIKTITLDFGAEVTEASIAGMVSLKAGNEDVTYSGVINGTKYVMTLDKLLKEKSTYVLTADESVCTELGADLGESFTFEFNTAAGSSTASIIGLYNGSTEVTNLSGYAEGNKLTVTANAVNTTSQAIDITVIAAFYNGNELVVATPYAGTVNAATFDTYTAEITLPSLTNVTNMEIYLWNSIDGMIPYCTVKPIPAA